MNLSGIVEVSNSNEAKRDRTIVAKLLIIFFYFIKGNCFVK
jgi:hypothetical protein